MFNDGWNPVGGGVNLFAQFQGLGQPLKLYLTVISIEVTVRYSHFRRSAHEACKVRTRLPYIKQVYRSTALAAVKSGDGTIQLNVGTKPSCPFSFCTYKYKVDGTLKGATISQYHQHLIHFYDMDRVLRVQAIIKRYKLTVHLLKYINFTQQ